MAIVDGQVEIKFQQLNPATHFQDVVDCARAVVLAGGTMSPVSSPNQRLSMVADYIHVLSQISDVVQQLFAKLSRERLATFSCGHIIPPTSLQMLVLKKGPRGGDLQYKYDKRNNQQSVWLPPPLYGLRPLNFVLQIAELGQILLNLVNVVPAGMVVFLPSYSFLNAVMAEWRKSGLIPKLDAKKKVSVVLVVKP